MKTIFKDSTFSFELLRTLGYTPYGGADVGEVFQTAQQIEEGDFDSWYVNWKQLADTVLERGKRAVTQGDEVSARLNYLKASNYYRTAEFFLHGKPNDGRALEAWGASRDTFWMAMRLSTQRVAQFDIFFNDVTMPATFYTIDDTPRPTMIVHGGYDSTGEELYFQVVQDALAHGYNVITFEGPGQGAVIREQHVPFLPNWEEVVGTVVDKLIGRPEVDQNQLVLMGISFGGLLAARAAAFEHRLAAVILDDGVFSFDFETAFRARSTGELTKTMIAEKIAGLMEKSTNVRWVIENGLFTFGVASVSELLETTKAYSLAGVLQNCQTPTLVCEAMNDLFFKGQPEQVYQELRAPKTLMTFNESDGAGEHCHVGALQFYNQCVFEWLNKTLAK